MVFIAGLAPVWARASCSESWRRQRNRHARRVHLLQWDVARRPFDAPALLARYPEVDGITHAVLRKAAGLWARDAAAAWVERHLDGEGLLAGETPLIGHRFVELVEACPGRQAEAALSSEATRFIVPVPTVAVKQAIEAARAATTTTPRHERERADAVPSVIRLLWAELLAAATQLAAASGAPSPCRRRLRSLRPT